MKNQIPKKKIVVELDPDDIDALDRARRDEGLSRTSFVRSSVVRRIRMAEANAPVVHESSR